MEKVFTVDAGNISELLDILEGLIHGEHAPKEEQKPREKEETDPIQSACAKFCQASETCDTCKYDPMISGNGMCAIGIIGGLSAQPIEQGISMALSYAKEHAEKPSVTYFEDYIAHHPEQRMNCVKREGNDMPPICRLSAYPESAGEKHRCPGNRPCWACWHEKMGEQ